MRGTLPPRRPKTYFDPWIAWTGRRALATGLSSSEPRELLVRDDPDQDHRAHDGEIERARDAEQVHEVLQDLQQDGAQHDAEHRALAAAQRATAQHSGGDAVELVEIAVA